MSDTGKDASDDVRDSVTDDDSERASEADVDPEIEQIKEQKKETLRSDSTPDEPIHVESKEQFDDQTDSDGVVLVDFHAEWCGPCQMLEPIVGAVAETMPATVVKVDVDDHQRIAQEYQVQSVPTLLVFSDGELVERMVGLKDEVEIGETIEQYA